MSKKPKVTTRCPANADTGPRERIIEVSFADGTGCLISFTTWPNGKHSIEVYRADSGIEVIDRVPRKVDSRKPTVTVRETDYEQIVDIAFANGAGAIVCTGVDGEDSERNYVTVTRYNHTIDVRTYDFAERRGPVGGM